MPTVKSLQDAANKARVDAQAQRRHCYKATSVSRRLHVK